MGFKTTDPALDDGDTNDSTSDDPAISSDETTTSSTSTSTTETSYSLDDTATGDSGGIATSDPAVQDTSDDTEQQAGGEHTYDVDESATEDPSLSYSSINDPRQTEADTTGTAGGEVEDSSVETGYVGLINPDQDKREEEIDAIADLTHDDSGNHTTDSIPDDPRYIVFDDGDPTTDSGEHTEPDWSGDGNPGGNLTDRVPDPDITPDVDLGDVGLAAAAVAIGAGILINRASSSGGGA